MSAWHLRADAAGRDPGPTWLRRYRRTGVAHTGGRDAATVVLSGTSLKEFCAKPPKTTFTRPDPCHVITRDEVTRIAGGQPFEECIAGVVAPATESFFPSAEGASGIFTRYDPTAARLGVTTAVYVFSYDLGGDAATTFPVGCRKLMAQTEAKASVGKASNVGDDNCYTQKDTVVLLLARRANIALMISVLTLDATVDKAAQVATTVLGRLS